MKYIEVKFETTPLEPIREILISELADIEFESFQDTENGVEAYVQQPLFSEEKLKQIIDVLKSLGTISYEVTELEEKNWNEVWESEYETVEVDNRCIVLAPFHEIDKSKYTYPIIINPKMSFGTGHHETTFLMLSFLLDMPVECRKVLDMGSGTGVLAILAALMKANHVDAVDIEDWAYENTLENAALNNVHLNVEKGDVSAIKSTGYDIILANINKNVLLADMSKYNEVLTQDGVLFLSGFFETDIAELTAHAEGIGMKVIGQKTRNNWASLKLSKA